MTSPQKTREFDEKAARTRAWNVFGFMEEPAHLTDKENFLTTYMVEQSRWQFEQDSKIIQELEAKLAVAQSEIDARIQRDMGDFDYEGT